jgi:hypothetical protein
METESTMSMMTPILDSHYGWAVDEIGGAYAYKQYVREDQP